MYGKDYEYAHSRLAGTVVLDAKVNKPIFVHRVLGDGLIRYEAFGWAEDGSRQISLNDLDVKPPLLGFCNTSRCAVYCSRVPRRGAGYRQGMRMDGLHQYPYGSITGGGVTSESLYKCIVGDYPSILSCLKASKIYIAKGKKPAGFCRAWHRHWALMGTGEVVYKTLGIVGEYNEKERRVILADEYRYLQEALEETL